MRNKLKKRIFEIIEPAENKDTSSKVFDKIILILITLNVLAVIFGSFDGFFTKYDKIFNLFELASIIIFSLEYLLRLYTSDYKYPAIQPTHLWANDGVLSPTLLAVL